MTLLIGLAALSILLPVAGAIAFAIAYPFGVIAKALDDRIARRSAPHASAGVGG